MKIRQVFLSVLVSCGLLACQSVDQKIVDQAIAAHGGKAFDDVNVTFDFRNMQYHLRRQGGKYSYTRTQTDSLKNTIKDVLTNEGLKRYIADAEQSLEDSVRAKYTRSVNSIAYFFLLPYGLNDPSVIKKYEGQELIKGINYQKLRVTFKQEGGGEDFQDEFLFWFHPENKQLDYLAYLYHTDGGGVRFRVAKNKKKVNEFIFQDYDNYGLEGLATPLDSLAGLFDAGKLPLLSEISNSNIVLK